MQLSPLEILTTDLTELERAIQQYNQTPNETLYNKILNFESRIPSGQIALTGKKLEFLQQRLPAIMDSEDELAIVQTLDKFIQFGKSIESDIPDISEALASYTILRSYYQPKNINDLLGAILHMAKLADNDLHCRIILSEDLVRRMSKHFPDATELDLSTLWRHNADKRVSFEVALPVILSMLTRLPKINRINLSGNHFSQAQLLYLATQLANKNQILGLNLSDCNINAQSGKQLFQLIDPDIMSVSQFIMNDNPLSDEGARELCYGLAVNYKVRTLHVERCGITDVGASHILTAMEHNKHLLRFNCANNRISELLFNKIRELTRENVQNIEAPDTVNRQQQQARAYEQAKLQQMEREVPYMTGAAEMIAIMQKINDQVKTMTPEEQARKVTPLIAEQLQLARRNKRPPKVIRYLEVTLDMRRRVMESVQQGGRIDPMMLMGMQRELEHLMTSSSEPEVVTSTPESPPSLSDHEDDIPSPPSLSDDEESVVQGEPVRLSAYPRRVIDSGAKDDSSDDDAQTFCDEIIKLKK